MTTFAERMAAVATAAGYVQKDARNTYHNYTYASADAVLTAVREAMAAQQLYIARSESLIVESHRVTDAKGREVHTVVLRKEVTVTDGAASVTVAAHGSGQDNGDKAVMKAETAAIKYAIAALFLVSWGDDPEADSRTDERSHGDARKGKPSAIAGQNPAEAAVTELREIMVAYNAAKPKDLGAARSRAVDAIRAFRAAHKDVLDEPKVKSALTFSEGILNKGGAP